MINEYLLSPGPMNCNTSYEEYRLAVLLYYLEFQMLYQIHLQ